ncbi:unnamed protein product [Ixodes pacificus]
MAAFQFMFRNRKCWISLINSACPRCRTTVISTRQKSVPSKDNPSSIVKPIAKTGHYVVSKLKFLLEGYDMILKKFPVAYRLHQVFLIGTRDLYQDIREYMRISQELRYGKSVRELSRKELELYFQIPRDIIKVAPVLFVIALPATNFFMFPLIYLFPKQLLTWHFWSLEQRVDFSVATQRKKVSNYLPVFRYMQANVPKGEEGQKLLRIFHKLGSGTHPTVEDILDAKQYFIDKPLALSKLSRKHLSSLCRIHGKSTFFLGRRSRLWRHGGFVHEMDLAMAREGIDQMDVAELRWACFLRGLNPMGLSKKDLIAWLQDWIKISSSIDSQSMSLLLHCPILLAYNQPSNWILIH